MHASEHVGTEKTKLERIDLAYVIAGKAKRSREHLTGRVSWKTLESKNFAYIAFRPFKLNCNMHDSCTEMQLHR